MPFRFMVGDGPLWLQMVKAVLARRPVHFRAGGSKGPAVEFTSYQIEFEPGTELGYSMCLKRVLQHGMCGGVCSYSKHLMFVF